MNFQDYLSNKLEGIVRYTMIHTMSDILPLYIVDEYPKSGGTWLGQMLGMALDVPFPRNRMPSITSSIMHCHLLKSWGMKNVVIIWRDARDMMVSWYYHCLFKHNRGNEFLVDSVSKILSFSEPENIKENLPTFIEYCFTKQFYPRFSWVDFVNSWHNKNGVVYTKYESLHDNAVEELQRIVLELTGEKLALKKAQEIVEYYSFKNQTGRNLGQQNTNQFLRKGIVGDWQNHFTKKSAQVFNHFAGKELILLGYVTDTTWENDLE